MLDFHRYHYAQILLYRPAISLLLKLQAKPQSVEVLDHHSFEGSFTQDTLRRFASKCLEAAVRTIDLLITYRGTESESMTPVQNFTPLCFCASKILIRPRVLLTAVKDLYNAMLVVVAARCCANDGLGEINLHKKWHQASKILQFYQATITTIEIPFKFLQVINERLFQGADEGSFLLTSIQPIIGLLTAQIKPKVNRRRICSNFQKAGTCSTGITKMLLSTRSNLLSQSKIRLHKRWIR